MDLTVIYPRLAIRILSYIECGLKEKGYGYFTKDGRRHPWWLWTSIHINFNSKLDKYPVFWRYVRTMKIGSLSEFPKLFKKYSRSMMGQFTKLRTLVYDRETKGKKSDEIFQQIEFPGLKRFILQLNWMNGWPEPDLAGKGWKEMRSLEHLTIEQCDSGFELSQKILDNLCYFPNLKELRLIGLKKVTSIAALLSNNKSPVLKLLDLTNCDFPLTNQTKGKAEKMILFMCPNVHDSFFSIDRNIINLRMNQCASANLGISRWDYMSNVTDLYIRYNQFKDFFMTINSFPSLERFFILETKKRSNDHCLEMNDKIKLSCTLKEIDGYYFCDGFFQQKEYPQLELVDMTIDIDEKESVLSGLNWKLPQHDKMLTVNVRSNDRQEITNRTIYVEKKICFQTQNFYECLSGRDKCLKNTYERYIKEKNFLPQPFSTSHVLEKTSDVISTVYFTRIVRSELLLDFEKRKCLVDHPGQSSNHCEMKIEFCKRGDDDEKMYILCHSFRAMNATEVENTIHNESSWEEEGMCITKNWRMEFKSGLIVLCWEILPKKEEEGTAFALKLVDYDPDGIIEFLWLRKKEDDRSVFGFSKKE